MAHPWREAASLILAIKASDSTPDYKLLLTRRSGKSSYLANTYCFPGGHIDLADFDSDWWKVFQEARYFRGDLNRLRLSHVPRPPIMTDTKLLESESKAKDNLASEIALRVAAIRETFEETGVLLAIGPKGSDVDVRSVIESIPDLKEWQMKVHDNPLVFTELFLTYDLVPDIWSLKEWWNWLTPAAVNHKRFDTMFYVACLDHMPRFNSDDNEVSQISWLSPEQVMMEHNSGDCWLAPPQAYELSRLANFTTFDDLKRFSHEREPLGVEQWCSNITGLSDGSMLTLPGDECYNLVINSAHLPSLEDMVRPCMNRLELRAPVFRAICSPSVTLTCGHIGPVTISHLNPSRDKEDTIITSDSQIPRLQSNL